MTLRPCPRRDRADSGDSINRYRRSLGLNFDSAPENDLVLSAPSIEQVLNRPARLDFLVTEHAESSLALPCSRNPHPTSLSIMADIVYCLGTKPNGRMCGKRVSESARLAGALFRCGPFCL